MANLTSLISCVGGKGAHTTFYILKTRKLGSNRSVCTLKGDNTYYCCHSQISLLYKKDREDEKIKQKMSINK